MQPIAMRDSVRRLLMQEAVGDEGQDALILSADRVLDKLRAHLSTRIGQEGFRTLLSRALSLTTERHPHLSAVRVEASGALAGLREASGALAGLREAAGVDSQATAVAAEALVAHLLELLVTFIGEDLTTRLLSAVWPEPAREEPVGDGLAGDGATGGESDTQ